jgi:hypothetical protein
MNSINTDKRIPARAGGVAQRATLVIAMENKFYEEFKVKGKDLVDKVKAIVHEGNARRIILKDEKGQTFLEIPLTVAAVGALAAPLVAALGAIAALVANFTLVVERTEGETPGKPETKN